ncbi:MAG: S1 RNA-binding domain-containing protein [Planctomycetaceae bacterium]|jgi:small subunit ribosomal protein S1|nr:S1 RNA-binding domain-containing protein [Planctomycetaceae bacterium]
MSVSGNPEVQVPKKILIGSQRNPGAYRPAPSILVVGDVKPEAAVPPPAPEPPKTVSYPSSEGKKEEGKDNRRGGRGKMEEEILPDEEHPDRMSDEGFKALRNVPPPPLQKVQIPRQDKISRTFKDDDLEAEFDAIVNSGVIDEMLEQTETSVEQSVPEPDTKVKGKVLEIQRDLVFLDIGAREQGVVATKFFPPDAGPKVGDEITVTVVRFLPEDGLYDVSVPLAAADVRDWSQVHEGMIVEAKITKTNTGGLECEVNRLRGFIPISQIELFRVENTEAYVGQKLTCVVEEVNPERRNLVLSRKSLLLREREEQRQKLWSELAVGQTREGTVRKIIDAGAFVDLGGVDGFIPIGRLAWGRVQHPSDVLTEGSRVSVTVSHIDEDTKRISLAYRDEASNPWTNITEKFQEKTIVRGKVSKVMEFGAFVELVPGLEGLIHISELSHKRVANVREAVSEGDWVNVFIVSIEPASKRVALSLKQAEAPPEPSASEPTPAASASQGTAASSEPPKPAEKYGQKGQLKGGTATAGGSNTFGLKW